jgi:hypothetical protein
MIIANNEPDHYSGLAKAVSAILFLGTPHQGSPRAKYTKILAQITNYFVIGTQTSRFTGPIRADLLSSLRTGEEGLLRIAEDFRIHTAGIKIYSFIEQKAMKGLNERVSLSLMNAFCYNSFLHLYFQFLRWSHVLAVV